MRNLDDYQKQYIKNNPFEPNMVRYRRQNIIKFINKYNPKSILEIGCANDPLFRYLKNFEKYIVVEPVKKFCDLAVEFSHEHTLNENIQIINNSFESQGEFLNDFDFIVCAGLLHEITNQRLFLENIFKLLEENTIVHLNVPNANSFHRLLGVKAGIIQNVNEKSDLQKRFQQNNIFSMEELKGLVKSIGFKIIDNGFITFKPFTHAQMQAILDEGILSIELIDSLAEMIHICPQNGAEIYLNLRR
tara:strand:- start:589 stop:1326 length:738 start_codon:yes stop_codon:yes gene_type:complete